MKIKKASLQDLPHIVEMLAHDPLGSKRELIQNNLHKDYITAYDNIINDKNQELIVLVDEQNVPIGTMQLSFIQYLTYQGGIRAQIEAVRIRNDKRGTGLGKIMFQWAIERSKERNAHLVQLTTDKKRPEAIRFYKDLGFVSSHEGMKKHL